MVTKWVDRAAVTHLTTRKMAKVAKDLEEPRKVLPGNHGTIEIHKNVCSKKSLPIGSVNFVRQTNLRQIQVADLMHVRQNRVSKFESRDIERTQVDALRKYVEALGENNTSRSSLVTNF